MPAVDFEQCIVGGTLDESLVHVEKLVLQPFQVDAGVRTAVEVSMKLPAVVHHEQFNGVIALMQAETHAARVFDVVNIAEKVLHGW